MGNLRQTKAHTRPCGRIWIRTKLFRMALILAMGLVLRAPTDVLALNFHVDQAAGSDSFTALQAQNPSQPWASVRHALRSVQSSGGPHTIHVAAGVYTEALESAYAGITLQGAPGAVLEAPANRSVLYVEHADFTLDGFEFRGGLHGLRADTANRLIIRNCVFRDAAKNGIHITNSQDVRVENSEALANGSRGILIERSAPSYVRNNLVTGNLEWGIEVDGGDAAIFPPGTQHLAAFNTVTQNGVLATHGGLRFENATGEIHGNILTSNAGRAIKVDTAPTWIHHNLFWAQSLTIDFDTGQEPLTWNLIEADPLFAGNGDYRVAAGSPAIDAGDREVLVSDIDGSIRTDLVPDTGIADLGRHVAASASTGVPPAGATPTPTPAPTPATDLEYFVNCGDGDDARDAATARNPATPWRSIRRGVLGAGSQNLVTVQEGTCSPAAEIQIDREDITVRARIPGSVTVIGPSGTNAFLIQSDGITLDGLRIRSDHRGILAAPANDNNTLTGITLRNLQIEGLPNAPLRFDAITVRQGQGIVIENNQIFGAGDRGIQLRLTSHSTVRNNLITGGSLADGASWAIDFENDPNSTAFPPPLSIGNLIVFNTVVGNRQGIRLNNAEGEIRDNIIANQSLSGLRVSDPGAGSLVHHNNSWNNGATGQNNYSMPSGFDLWSSNRSLSPGFVDSLADDFRLQQIAAGDLQDSLLLDLGSAPIGTADISGSTRRDGLPDQDMADPGFHQNSGIFGDDLSAIPLPIAQHYFVDCRFGDDQRSWWEAGRAWDGWATIGKALAQAVPGDTISLVGGSCQEAVEIETAGVTLRSATPGSGIIEPLPGQIGIRVEADDVHLIGLTVRASLEGVRVARENSDRSIYRVHLQSLLVEAPIGSEQISGKAILLSDTYDSIVEGSIVRQARLDGIAVQTGEINGAVGGGRNWVHNNLVTDCGEWGIRVRSEAAAFTNVENVVSSNTVHGNGSTNVHGGIAFQNATGEIRNNIVTSNSGQGIKTNTLPLLLHHNLVFANPTAYETSSDAKPVGWANLSQDPLFRDSDAGDFRLQQLAAGDPFQSPAVDAGSGTTSESYISGTTRVDGVIDQAIADLGYHADASGNATAAVPGDAPSNLVRDFFVDAATGDDERHVLEAMDPASPWKTIGQALRSNGARRGDIVRVRAGTYNESVETSNEGVTIVADPQVIIMAGGENGFLIEHNDITIEGFRIEGARHGIRADRAERLQIRSNEVVEPSDTGIKITRSSDGIVDSNTVHGAVSSGIHGTDSPSLYLRNNLVTESGDWSIQVDTTQGAAVVHGTLVAFNTVAQFGTGGIRLANATGTIRDNIVFGSGNVGVKTDTAPVDIHHNNIFGPNSLFDRASGQEPRRWSNRSEGPDFVDSLAGDYRLLSIAAGDSRNSPLLESGSAPADSVEADISGSVTRDGVLDTGWADLGYHQDAGSTPGQPVATIAFSATPETGAVFQVAPDGDNTNPSGAAIHPETAWRTIRYAVRQLAPGDSLEIAAGDYPESISIQSAGVRLFGSRTPGATRLLPPSGELGISIEGHDNVVIESLTIEGGAQSLKAVDTTGLRIRQVASVNAETTGLKVEDSSDVWVDSSVVTEANQTGLLLLRSDQIFLRNNRIYTNGGWGISIDNETGSEAKPILPISTGNLLAFNTVHANSDGIRIVGASAEIRDNIISNQQDLGLYLKGDEIFAHHNAFAFNQRDRDRENDSENIFFWDYIGHSPKYVDPAGPDGQLGGSGWLDDSFFLSNIPAGQTRNSLVIDRGSADPGTAGIDGSTSSDLEPDTGTVDPGFHAGASPATAVPSATVFDPTSLRGTYFVSSQFGSDGTDDEPRTSATARDPVTPWATLRYAVSRAAEGDTIILLPGVYRNSIQIERDGITIKAETPDSVVLEPLPRENTETGVLEPTTSFTIEAEDITLDGLRIRGASTGISALTGSNGLRIRNCMVLESQGDGIRIFESEGVRIENTIVASNLYAGIKLRRSTRVELENNLVYGNGEWGISLDNSSASDDNVPPLSENNLLAANTITNNAVGNLRIENSAGTVRDNLISDAIGIGLKIENSDVTLQHNGFWNPADPAQAISPAEALFCQDCTGNIWANPHFLSPTGGDGSLGGAAWRDDDFRLSQIGSGQTIQSPAVDAGSDQALLLGLTGTTAASGTPDLGMADLGYHYANGARSLAAIQWRDASTAALLHVDATLGNDDYTRTEATNASTPWATIRHALSQLVPGDTLIIGAGVWQEAMDIRVSDVTILGSDSLGSTTLSPDSRRDAIRVRAARVEIRNLAIDGGRRGISLYRQAENIHLQDLSISNVRSDGITLRGNPGVTIDSVTLSGCRRTGIYGVRATEVLIRNVQVTACRRGGIGMSRSSGLIEFVTIHSAGRTGISLRRSPDLELRDSIITGHAGWGVNMRARNGEGSSLHHLLLGNNRIDIYPESAASSPDILTNSDPLYSDPDGPDGIAGGTGWADDDLSLSLGSPAIDKGSDEAFVLGVDQSSTQAKHGTPDTGIADLGAHQ